MSFLLELLTNADRLQDLLLDEQVEVVVTLETTALVGLSVTLKLVLGLRFAFLLFWLGFLGLGLFDTIILILDLLNLVDNIC